jgi:3-isopropylmalate/(R)-2-methylmalate dehydratase large subunit
MPTLLHKLWSSHVVSEIEPGVALLQIDRHLIHDLVAGPALRSLTKRGIGVRNPELTFATVDHALPSTPGHAANVAAPPLLQEMRQRTAESRIRFFDIGSDWQGIVHVMAPELGLSLPGLSIVCGDSHTCTNGALGALAFGIGSSEVVHVLATQTLRQRRPGTMQVSFEGIRPQGITAKDLILHAIGRLGTAAGQGCALEFAGSAIRSMSMEERFTICNLSIEMGSKIGLIAADDTTFEYVAGRPFAPTGAQFDVAIEYWRTMRSDEDSSFDREHVLRVEEVVPQITWGTSPQDVIPVTGAVPDPAAEADPARRRRLESAMEYMGLTPGKPIAGTPVDWVFIGSCANSRL